MKRRRGDYGVVEALILGTSGASDGAYALMRRKICLIISWEFYRNIFGPIVMHELSSSFSLL